MRSIFLECIATEELAREGLSAEFPDQSGSSTKVVVAPGGKDPVGYIYVGLQDAPEEQRGPFLIQADYSGRILDFDPREIVWAALVRLQTRIGGEIRDYGE